MSARYVDKEQKVLGVADVLMLAKLDKIPGQYLQMQLLVYMHAVWQSMAFLVPCKTSLRDVIRQNRVLDPDSSDGRE